MGDLDETEMIDGIKKAPQERRQVRVRAEMGQVFEHAQARHKLFPQWAQRSSRGP